MNICQAKIFPHYSSTQIYLHFVSVLLTFMIFEVYDIVVSKLQNVRSNSLTYANVKVIPTTNCSISSLG